ncbi:TSUP family transporter [Streptomyces sp. P17]|uniref:TSUP family transporter n=1 Tax=Streptomyces sp. P17 TaxID=3074716 RepID=UPI0028F42250|nr:TSUP family transporter [Streptomyces sp. P17]MDT9701179.1 TSUP family transporter [Streptomyces sp. P17]
MRVLLVEDDEPVAQSLRRGLTRYGLEVEWVATGGAALKHDGPYDVVLLDLGLPDTDGLDVCKALRGRGEVPITVTSARCDETDRVVGLELGADDYVSKPFGVREVIARTRAVMRRVQPREAAAAGPDRYGSRLTIDRKAARVRLDGEEVALAPEEYDLLAFLTEKPGVLMTAPLCTAAACTVPAATWMTRQLPELVLLLVMGALVTVAVLLVMRGARVGALRATGGAVAAGAVGGFMNSAAGVGGPPMSLYAVNAGWSVREFVPNAMFYGVVVNAFSVASNGLPELTAPRWAAVVAAMALGGVIGRGLASRIPERRARLLVLTLALTGGVTALGKGLWGLAT